MIKNINNLKSKILKLIDKWNDRYYFYQPQTVDFYNPDIDLEQKEQEIFADIVSRISPDGIYNYRWDVQEQARGIKMPDIGDLCLHHHLLIAAITLRALQSKDGGVTFKTLELLKRLLKASEMFITEDVYLIRGFRDYYKNGDWKGCKRVYADAEVSGDQLGGFVFGLSIAYKYFPQLFSENLKEKILLFTDRMITNKMMLQDFRTGKTCSIDKPFWKNQFEISYDSPLIIEGHVTTKLVLLSLAYSVSFNGKYAHWYCKLRDDYSFDKLTEYSIIHFIVPLLKKDINNWFGTHINAISLFAIGLNMDFPDYVKRGLSGIARQTRDYGYGLYDLLDVWANNINPYIIAGKVRQALYSHFAEVGEDIFVKNIFGKKIRVASLSIRARGQDDYPPQRNPFFERNNKNPDLWEMGNCGNHGFLLEYWLAKHLGVI